MGAVRDVDRTLVTVARSLGATTWQLYWKVLLPAIVPSVLGGMRLGVVFCLLGVLVVEMFAGVASDDKDPHRSVHVEQFPLPELAPDEAFVAVMAIVLALDHLNDKPALARLALRAGPGLPSHRPVLEHRSLLASTAALYSAVAGTRGRR
jgi:ABC-type proline/glycine betaine transport system permease subunit